MRNIERLLRRLEAKTERRFEGEKPYCTHVQALVSFPDGTIEGDAEFCRECSKPQLKVTIVYDGCESIRTALLREARAFLAEQQLENQFDALDADALLEIICDEFQVAPADLIKTICEEFEMTDRRD